MGARDEETIDLCYPQSQDSETDDDTQGVVAQPCSSRRHAMHPHAAGPFGSQVAAPPHKTMAGASACASPQSTPHALCTPLNQRGFDGLGATEIDLTSSAFAVGGISGGAIPVARQNSDSNSDSKCIMIEVDRATRRLRWEGEASKDALAGRVRGLAGLAEGQGFTLLDVDGDPVVLKTACPPAGGPIVTCCPPAGGAQAQPALRRALHHPGGRGPRPAPPARRPLPRHLGDAAGRHGGFGRRHAVPRECGAGEPGVAAGYNGASGTVAG
jgi:hypothetical protein